MSVSMTKSVMIDAPRERVLEVEHDLASQPDWWPGMLEAEVLATDDRGRPALARLVNEVAKIGRDEFRLNFVQREDGLSWTLDRPSVLQKLQNGDWTFTEMGESTEARLSLEIELSIPLPGFVQKRILDGVVKGALAGLKKTCEA